MAKSLPPLEWRTEKRKVSELTPYEKNPRKISRTQYQKLLESFQCLGYMSTMIAQPDGTIIGGHARRRALKELKYKEVDVRIPNRPLTEDEFKEALLRDNVLYGDWDKSALFENFGAELVDHVGIRLDDVNIAPTQVKFSVDPKPKMVECPECHHVFDRKSHPAK